MPERIRSIQRSYSGVPIVAQQKQIWLASMRTWVWSLASLSGLRIQHCRELWCRWKTQLWSEVLWLWCRPAAVAPIQPLAWEPPYVTGADLKSKTQKQKQKTNKQNQISWCVDSFCNDTGFILFYFICLFRGAPVAYGSSQARGWISATAAGLYHSHSKSRFKLHLWPIPQLMAMPDP